MPVKGGDKWLARLRRAKRVDDALDQWAMEGAEVVAAEARDLVNEGGIPSPNHVVSNPGSPPNTDTGNLVAHTNAEDLPEKGQAAVVSDAMNDGYCYSTGLEFGTSRMAERPFLRPATANKRQHVVTLARNAVNRVTK